MHVIYEILLLFEIAFDLHYPNYVYPDPIYNVSLLISRDN